VESAERRRVLGLLGLALRQRAVVLGRTACRRAAERRRLHLVLIAADAGGSAARDGAIPTHVACVRVPFGKAELGGVVGRAEVALLGITDPHLSAGLLECARTDDT
jgi:ribosomal protein L7Ae-like RNA K-turn-binding protein